MTRARLAYLAALAGGGLLLATASAAQTASVAPRYPETRRDSTVDTIFGTAVPDPYRWLEAGLKQDPEVRRWVDAQNSVTNAYIGSYPQHDAIRAHVAKLWNIEKLGAPRQRGGRLFFSRNSGVQDQSAIYVQDGPTGAPRLLLDPNLLKTDGDLIVQDWEPSPDGRLLLYTTQVDGGDWRTIRILDVESGRTLDDRVEGLKAAQYAWLPDGTGFYYAAFDAPGNGKSAEDMLAIVSATSEVRFHRIGDAQSADQPVYRDGSGKPYLHNPDLSDDGRWLVVTVIAPSGLTADVRVLDRNSSGEALKSLAGDGSGGWRFIGSSGNVLLFSTTQDAPMGRIVALDPSRGRDQSPRVLVPEGTQPIQSAVIAGDQLVVRYLDVTQSALRRFTLSGQPKGEVALPEHAVVDQIQGRARDRDLYFMASTMSRPATVYRFDTRTGKSSIFREPDVPWDPDDYVIRRIRGTSRDGTVIPVTVAYRRDLDISKGAPTVLMGYGGWGISPGLEFYESRFAWMNMGGIFAIAHTRGGAEYGRAWYEVARKGGRVKTFEDFIAATEQLQREGLATPAQTVAIGASNGGILVAAAANMRPDLYGVVIPRVPMTEMIRFPRFTIGRLFTEELGDPDKPEEFRMLLGYSPLHNIRSGTNYPAILVTTADTDDRVVPAHSFKYVATLQASDIGSRPHLLRVEFGSGHGQGKTQSKLIEEFGDLWSFAAMETGLKPILK